MALVPFPGGKTGALQVPPDDPDDLDDSSEGKMSFLEHLEELRKRIINSCLGIAAGIGFSFFFIQQIFEFLMAPANATLPAGSRLIYTQPTEAFALYIQISLISGAVFASPWIKPNMFGLPGLTVKSSISLLSKKPAPVTVTPLPNEPLSVVVSATAMPLPSTTHRFVVCSDSISRGTSLVGEALTPIVDASFF